MKKSYLSFNQIMNVCVNVTFVFEIKKSLTLNTINVCANATCVFSIKKCVALILINGFEYNNKCF
jgi:hypothetical protein